MVVLLFGLSRMGLVLIGGNMLKLMAVLALETDMTDYSRPFWSGMAFGFAVYGFGWALRLTKRIDF